MWRAEMYYHYHHHRCRWSFFIWFSRQQLAREWLGATVARCCFDCYYAKRRCMMWTSWCYYDYLQLKDVVCSDAAFWDRYLSGCCHLDVNNRFAAITTAYTINHLFVYSAWHVLRMLWTSWGDADWGLSLELFLRQLHTRLTRIWRWNERTAFFQQLKQWMHTCTSFHVNHKLESWVDFMRYTLLIIYQTQLGF